MTTALQIINRAAEVIGYKTPSEKLSGDDASSFLSILNDMVDGWNTGRLNVVATATASASVSSSPVSVGSGQTLDVGRPIRIEDGWIRQNSIDYPLHWITSAEYDAIPNKSDTSTLPSKAFYSPGLPSGSIYLWPTPSGSVSLHVRVMQQLSEFADLASNYDLAPGYRRALEYSLAEELAPGRQRVQQDVARLAFSARRSIKVANYEPLKLDSGVHLPFNIYTGR